MPATVHEIVRCLRKDLGAEAGARYARRVANTRGMYAGEYERAAEILEREALRAHQAADPHCTCPDCIVDHFNPDHD
jgi:hypothetical protein